MNINSFLYLIMANPKVRLRNSRHPKWLTLLLGGKIPKRLEAGGESQVGLVPF
ncbi:MAG: hypothetical protein HOH60_03750 [Opitutae bacterium]|nr:hypothetical protein [Opitutae bacterium]